MAWPITPKQNVSKRVVILINARWWWCPRWSVLAPTGCLAAAGRPYSLETLSLLSAHLHSEDSMHRDGRRTSIQEGLRADSQGLQALYQPFRADDGFYYEFGKNGEKNKKQNTKASLCWFRCSTQKLTSRDFLDTALTAILSLCFLRMCPVITSTY